MRETGLAKETVRRFYRAATAGELLAKVRDGRPSLLDDCKPYLHQRWNEGCTNVRQLHAELRERGYKGSYGTIRDYVLPFRESGAAPPAVPGPLKARDLASWASPGPQRRRSRMSACRPAPPWSSTTTCSTSSTRAVAIAVSSCTSPTMAATGSPTTSRYLRLSACRLAPAPVTGDEDTVQQPLRPAARRGCPVPLLIWGWSGKNWCTGISSTAVTPRPRRYSIMTGWASPA